VPNHENRLPSAHGRTLGIALPAHRKHPQPKPRACATCGVVFTPPAWRVARGGGKYCSPFCYHEGTRDGPIKQLECEHCGTPFTRQPSNAKNGRGKYCSQQCHYDARRRYPIPEARVCARPGCDHQFTPKAVNVAVGRGRYCSRECWSADRFRLGLISDGVVGRYSGRGRQRWYGRWNGYKGTADGIERGREGGRPPIATKEQAAECWRLRRAGLNHREISAAVFGDVRYRGRVQRLFAGS
jgi:hypothetical protein